MPDDPNIAAATLLDILRAHPHLRERVADAATPEGLASLKQAFPDITPAGWTKLQQQATLLTPPRTGEDAGRDLLTPEEKKHGVHGGHRLRGTEGSTQGVKLDEAEEHALKNTVTDWNTQHRNDPAARVTGPLFSRGADGKMILSDEVVQKIPHIQDHLGNVITTAYGPSPTPYRSPKDVLEEFQKSVERDAQLEVGRAREALQAAQGPGTELSAAEVERIQEATTKRRYDEAVNRDPEQASYFAKRRWKGLRGPRDGQMQEALSRRKQYIHSLYKTPHEDPYVSNFQRYVTQQTDKAVGERISQMQARDRANGVSRFPNWYEGQVNRGELEKSIANEEFARLYKLNPQKLEVYATRDPNLKQLLDSYEKSQQVAPEEVARQRIQARQDNEKYQREVRRRNPQMDPRITQAEQRITTLTDAEYKRQARITSDANARNRRVHWKVDQITPPDRAAILKQVRDQEYYRLFGQNPTLSKKFARQDAAYRKTLREWRAQQELLRKERLEAYKYTKKRGLLRRLWHKIRPYKPRYVTLPDGTVVDSKARRWSWKRLRLGQRIEDRLNPLRNRYDNARDWISRQNERFNPYLILKRKLFAYKERLKAKLKKAFYKTRIGKLYKRYLRRRYIMGQYVEKLKERFSLKRRFKRWFAKTRLGKGLKKFWDRYSPKALLKRLGKFVAKAMMRMIKMMAKAAAKLAVRMIAALAGPIGMAIASVAMKVLGKVLGAAKKILGAIMHGKIGQLAKEAVAKLATLLVNALPFAHAARIVVGVIIVIIVLILFIMADGSLLEGDDKITVKLTKTGPATVVNPDPADNNETGGSGSLPSDIKYALNVSYTGSPGMITVVDQLPPEVDFVTAGGPGNPIYNKDAHTVTWTIPLSSGTASGSGTIGTTATSLVEIFKAAAQEYNVPAALLMAVNKVEAPGVFDGWTDADVQKFSVIDWWKTASESDLQKGWAFNQCLTMSCAAGSDVQGIMQFELGTWDWIGAPLKFSDGHTPNRLYPRDAIYGAAKLERHHADTYDTDKGTAANDWPEDKIKRVAAAYCVGNLYGDAAQSACSGGGGPYDEVAWRFYQELKAQGY